MSCPRRLHWPYSTGLQLYSPAQHQWSAGSAEPHLPTGTVQMAGKCSTQVALASAGSQWLAGPCRSRSAAAVAGKAYHQMVAA
jgi:hypothetical protein